MNDRYPTADGLAGGILVRVEVDLPGKGDQTGNAHECSLTAQVCQVIGAALDYPLAFELACEVTSGSCEENVCP